MDYEALISRLDFGIFMGLLKNIFCHLQKTMSVSSEEMVTLPMKLLNHVVQVLLLWKVNSIRGKIRQDVIRLENNINKFLYLKSPKKCLLFFFCMIIFAANHSFSATTLSRSVDSGLPQKRTAEANPISPQRSRQEVADEVSKVTSARTLTQKERVVSANLRNFF